MENNTTKNTYEEMTAVLEALRDGKEIEFYRKDQKKWMSSSKEYPLFGFFKYRVKPTPPAKLYRPWTAEEAIGKTISDRRGTFRVITRVEGENAYSGAFGASFEELLEEAKQLDGSPCGVEVGVE